LKKYFGAKNGGGMYQNIINLIPPHKKYYEIYGGSLYVMRKKSIAAVTVINELDRFIVSIYKKYFGNCSSVDIYNKPAVEILSSMTHGIDSFIYLDPPYPKCTRRSFGEYRKEMSMSDHKELLSTVVTVKSNCMISTYDNPLYNSMLCDWNKKHFDVMTRNGWRKETVYFNYEVPTELHDYKYLGSNCTERQRIKRKINREINKLQKLPQLERNAILKAIKSQYPLSGQKPIT